MKRIIFLTKGKQINELDQTGKTVLYKLEDLRLYDYFAKEKNKKIIARLKSHGALSIHREEKSAKDE
jgi:hypothetical protein